MARKNKKPRESEQVESLEPPELPELDRRLKFSGWQLVGLAAIVLLPVLAAFRLFGERSATAADRGSDISLVVEYPSRARHGTLEAITAVIGNGASFPLDTVIVRFDTGYVARFTDPQFVPSATRAHEVELTDLVPGETRRVQLGVRANEYGRLNGTVAAVHETDSAVVRISTFVFP